MKIEFSTMSDWSPVSEYYVRFVVSDSTNRAGRHSELTLDADKMPSSKIASKQFVTRSRPRLIRWANNSGSRMSQNPFKFGSSMEMPLDPECGFHDKSKIYLSNLHQAVNNGQMLALLVFNWLPAGR